MNKASYINRSQRNFPVSTEGLDFIQNQILLAAEYAKTAGANYILSGCVKNGNSVSDGTVIINGEILPFAGGALQDTIRIVETKQDITAGSNTYENAYLFRRVEFGSNVGNANTYSFSSLTKFPTNQFLLENSATKKEVEALMNLAMPIGAIVMWSGSVTGIPAGFALCNGATVNGIKTPDLRGRFIVGYSVRRADEAGRGESDYGEIGNIGGSEYVTLSVEQIPPHQHDISFKNERWGGSTHDRPFPADGGTASYTAKTKSGAASRNGAHENRPPYYTLAFIIKTV